jgi:hypothetical protein
VVLAVQYISYGRWGGAKMIKNISFHTLHFNACQMVNNWFEMKRGRWIPMQKSKANRMVPSILAQTGILAWKNNVKVKNDQKMMGFSIGHDQTILYIRSRKVIRRGPDESYGKYYVGTLYVGVLM